MKDRVTGTTVGPLVPGNGVELNHASSIFHFLDQPPLPLPGNSCSNFAKNFILLFPGVHSAILYVGGLAAGHRAVLRQTEVSEFFPPQGGCRDTSDQQGRGTFVPQGVR